MKKHILLPLTIFFQTLPTIANTPTAPLVTTANQPNIKILSDQMDCDQARHVCIAKGNATAEKLNDKKTKVLKADQITAHFAKDAKSGSTQVTHLEADGNVFFVIGDIAIQGKQGEYLVESGIAKVKDDVKITHGENQLDGGYAEVNMETGHYSLRHDGEQVQAMIYTKDNVTEKK